MTESERIAHAVERGIPIGRVPKRPDVFCAVAHPARRAIIERLADGEAEAGDLAEVLWVRYHLMQSSASNHLRVLRDLGVVRLEVDGTRRWYSLRPDALVEVRAWILRCTSGT